MLRNSLVTLAALAWLGASACGDDGGVGSPGDAGSGSGDATADATPGGADGSGDARVDAGGETSGPEAGEVGDAGLRISGIDPDRGKASGGDQVEIRGSGFAEGIRVFFGESQAQEAFATGPERIVAKTPPRTPGLTDVRVVGPEGEREAVLEDGFLFFNPVEVTAVQPTAGHVDGGQPITVEGAGFRPGSSLLIGGRKAVEVEVIDDRTIQAVTPSAPEAGRVDVHVSNDQGIGRLAKGYRYVRSPSVDRVVPPAGPLAGGTEVTIRGAGFVAPVDVRIDGKPLQSQEIEDAQTIAGTVPAGSAPGPVDVEVSTSHGASVGRNAFSYLGDEAPEGEVALHAVTPPAGGIDGGHAATLVAEGLTHAGDTEVTFGGEPAEVKSVDADLHRVVVEVPAAEEAGTVDVTLSNGNGSATATGAYTYERRVRVEAVTPNYGPTDGGTAVTVEGRGFDAGLDLRIGALPASSVEVIDEETIEAVTPPGSPGLANVSVEQDSGGDTLVGGFAYQADLALWVVKPPRGSRAGGTQIELFGSGFPQDATVEVGGAPATHVDVTSPTRITARTPPGEVGTVDVTLRTPGRGEVTLSDAFTYYDPSSRFGGTWGGTIEGQVNVSVLNAQSGQPMADVFVMLWTDPATPYQDFTDKQGQVTFSGPDLRGEQMVTASKEGFASTSVVEYDATNITLYMTPSSQGSGPPPPGDPPPQIQGQVVNAVKYIPVPWGQCSDKSGAPGDLCKPCESDDDCSGARCTKLPQQDEDPNYCTVPCGTTDDCPSGFICQPLNGVESRQCVPSTGNVTAYCDFTRPTVLSRDPITPPGQQVAEDFSFQMPQGANGTPPPVGEFALFCWGGIENADTGNFTPHVLGVKRHLQAQPGDVLEPTVTLTHSLDSELKVQLDDPPSGPDFNAVFTHLDLGSDGIFQFPSPPIGFGDEALVQGNVPEELTGNLYDAQYTLFGGGFSNSQSGLPWSVTLERGIEDLTNDLVFVRDQDGWEGVSSGMRKNINDLWGGSDRLLGVGSDGTVVRRAGGAWASQASQVSEHLRGVDGLPSGEAIAVGDAGTAIHYDGSTWNSVPTPSQDELRDVWMAGPDEAIAVGWYSTIRWNGDEWTSVSSGDATGNLRAVHGFGPDDIWAVGNFGDVVHWDGDSWSEIDSGSTHNLRDVWGAAPDDVHIVGEDGTILHWDGEELTSVDHDLDLEGPTLTSVWGRSASEVYAVGSGSTILEWDGSGWSDATPSDEPVDLRAVAASGEGPVVTTGAHELILGPLLTLPKNVDPADGGTMGTDYGISWEVDEGPEPHFSQVRILVPSALGPPSPEWTTVNAHDVTSVDLPQLPSIEGTPGIEPGQKILSIQRVYKEGFDIDNYSNQDLNPLQWESWSTYRGMFTKE